VSAIDASPFFVIIISFATPFRYLLRGLGAIYIKRKIDGADGKKDYIYRGLLQTYLQESLRSGHHMEFFIEGGRTRTGKPGIPKVTD
jgi:glycerol-3-phosphate O-acyltransferase 1/2